MAQKPWPESYLSMSFSQIISSSSKNICKKCTEIPSNVSTQSFAWETSLYSFLGPEQSACFSAKEWTFWHNSFCAQEPPCSIPHHDVLAEHSSCGHEVN